MSTGTKFDQGKAPMEMLPPELLHYTALVYKKGAEKYGLHNFYLGMDWGRLIGALYRHTTLFNQGENDDKETGLPHLAHIAATAGILLVYQERKLGKDNRYKTGYWEIE